MHSCPCAHCLAAGQVAKLPLSLSGRLPSWASPFLRRLANASGRIEFIIFLIMDWSFASGCSPPRPSATQLPSATDSQCSVRWGLSPHCWCALSGAHRRLYRTHLRGAGNHQSLGFLPRTAVSFSVILLSDLRVQCRLRLLLRAQGAETSRGTKEGSNTSVGSNNFFMVGAHLGHNTRVADHVILANNVLLGDS